MDPAELLIQQRHAFYELHLQVLQVCSDNSWHGVQDAPHLTQAVERFGVFLSLWQQEQLVLLLCVFPHFCYKFCCSSRLLHVLIFSPVTHVDSVYFLWHWYSVWFFKCLQIWWNTLHVQFPGGGEASTIWGHTVWWLFSGPTQSGSYLSFFCFFDRLVWLHLITLCLFRFFTTSYI